MNRSRGEKRLLIKKFSQSVKQEEIILKLVMNFIKSLKAGEVK